MLLLATPPIFVEQNNVIMSAEEKQPIFGASGAVPSQEPIYREQKDKQITVRRQGNAGMGDEREGGEWGILEFCFYDPTFNNTIH